MNVKVKAKVLTRQLTNFRWQILAPTGHRLAPNETKSRSRILLDHFSIHFGSARPYIPKRKIIWTMSRFVQLCENISLVGVIRQPCGRLGRTSSYISNIRGRPGVTSHLFRFMTSSLRFWVPLPVLRSWVNNIRVVSSCYWVLMFCNGCWQVRGSKIQGWKQC